MPSPYVDLRDGFEAYRAAKRASGSKLFDEMARLQRKLAREHGTVTVEPTHDESCLEHLIAWKEQHCRHTQAANIFPFHWPAAMLRAVLRHQTGDDFGGIMWRLSAGGRPIAANVVLRARATAYGWFMSFDPAFRRYSPGMLLLMRVLEECSRAGIRRFDLGKGTSGFKQRVMNAAAEVAEGSIDSRLMVGAIWRNWLQLRERVRKSPLRTSARRVDRILTRFRWLIGSSH